MKLIQDKKLFGKINTMDIVLLIIILIVGIVGYKVVFKSDTPVSIGAKYFKTLYTVKLDNLPKGVSEYLSKENDVYDNETNTYVGKLIDFKSGDYILIKNNYEEEKFVEAVIPNKESVYLTIEVEVSDEGADLITSNNYYIKVGKRISLRSGNFAGSGFITKIDREVKNEGI